MVTLEHKLS